jgi:hypothetical protein
MLRPLAALGSIAAFVATSAALALALRYRALHPPRSR